MADKPMYSVLERKITKLEKEALEYMLKEREFHEERKLVEFGHMRRTLSLMKMNEEEIRKCRNRVEELVKQIE